MRVKVDLKRFELLCNHLRFRRITSARRFKSYSCPPKIRTLHFRFRRPKRSTKGNHSFCSESSYRSPHLMTGASFLIQLKINRADIENRTLFSGVEVRHITNYALSAFVEASRFELLFSTATLVMCIRHAGYTSIADQVRFELTIFSLTDCCLCHLSF